MKIFFQPGMNIGNAIAQVTAIPVLGPLLPPGTRRRSSSSTTLRPCPSCSSGFSGQGLSEQELADMGQNFLRIGLITIPGIAVPYPYGGKQRQVQVDLNTPAMQAKGLSPLDVVNAIDDQNLILPRARPRSAFTNIRWT